MRKVLAITLTLILILSFVGCKKDTANKKYDSSNSENSTIFSEENYSEYNSQSKDDEVNSSSSSNTTSGNKTSSNSATGDKGTVLPSPSNWSWYL